MTTAPEFCARTRRLRIKTGMTQRAMAEALGISEDAYRKNESRSPLPHRLVARFAAITGVSVEFVMTGRDSRPRSSLAARLSGK
jgi:transcriptional regulator with XRE-family HTH domain